MLIAQIIGIVAMLFSVMSFQQKTQKQIVLMQLIGSTLWCVHFFLLDAPAGCFLNAIAAIRNVVFYQKDLRWTSGAIWIPVITLLSLGVYLLDFTVWGLEFTMWNAVLEFLPVIAMVSSTVAMRMDRASKVRGLSLIGSPLWLCYDFFNHSVGGVMTEVISLISIAIGILRLDLKRKK